MKDWRKTWAFRIALSRLALFWEGAWPALWPAAQIAGLFLLVALLDILPMLPGWLHGGILLIAAGGLLWALWRGVRALRIPAGPAAERRLERVNNLPHRPFDALDDEIATPDPHGEGARLWQLHRARMAKMLQGIRAGWPRPGLIRRDPFATRIALGAVLAVSAFAAGGDAPAHLLRAVTPQSIFSDTGSPVTLDAWITPPAYTGLPPVFLTGADRKAGDISVPAGSVLLAQVTGGGMVPQLVSGVAQTEFTAIEAESYRIEHELTADTAIDIMSRDRKLDSWTIAVTADRAPVIALAQPPAASQQSALHLSYTASDDYGLDRVKMVIRRGSDAAGEPLSLDIPLPSVNPRDVRAEHFRDLTPHPWAGLTVRLTLVATDAIGQEGMSDTVEFILPERIFNHPVARQIIAERKKLSENPEANHVAVAEALKKIGLLPDLFANDIVVFMGLDVAARRVLKDWQGESLAAVQQLLWDTALRVENGSITLAEADLRRAEDALRDALSREAPDEEIERLIEELQAALDKYLDELTKQLQKQAERGELQEMDPALNTMTRQDLQDMMDQIREMAKSGAREAAKQMLAEMQKRLENMRAGIAQPQQNSQQSRASKMMNDLQQLTKGQKDLLDRTFRQSQQGQDREGQQSREQRQGDQGQRQQQGNEGRQSQGQPNPGGQPQAGQTPGQSDASAVLQEAIRRQLGNVMQRYAEMTGDVPQAFGRAEQAMRRSTGALRQGQPGEAIDPQSQALDALQQATQQAMQQMQQMMEQQMGLQPGGRGQMPGRQQSHNRDPFGRDHNEGAQGTSSDKVTIPDKSDLQRSREIRDELRKRSSERERPQIERDYIDRLLKQF
ncbi:MAG: TIGR02302 family protein [Alphaproteobacteria bacterium]